MSLTASGTPIPISNTVSQKVVSDGTNLLPVHYNDSNAGGRKKTAISTATTTTVLSGGGWLRRLHVPGTGGTLGNVTVYDATTATGTPIFGPTTPTAGQIIDLQLRCDVGITVVTAAATALWAAYDADAS